MHTHKANWVGSVFAKVAVAALLIAALAVPFYHSVPSVDTGEEMENLDIPTRLNNRSLKASKIPDFGSITDVAAKKKAFFNYLRPAIKRQNDFIRADRLFLLGVMDKLQQQRDLNDDELLHLDELAEAYKVDQPVFNEDNLKRLLKRVDVVPLELVLVQAANESAWGTSRFARQGYNFFGIWCYRRGCGFVPSQRNTGADHEVAKFSSLSHAVQRYLLNINTHRAYRKLRDLRAQMRANGEKPTAEGIAMGLINYSQRREEYVAELLDMIDHNQEYFE